MKRDIMKQGLRPGPRGPSQDGHDRALKGAHGDEDTGGLGLLLSTGALLFRPVAAACLAVAAAGCAMESPVDECSMIGVPSDKCAEVLGRREASKQAAAMSVYAQDAAYLRGYIDGKNGDPPRSVPK